MSLASDSAADSGNDGSGVIRVAVIEDHPLYREALDGVLRSTPGLELILSVSTIEEFDARLTDSPNVVLADLHLPGLDGAAGIKHLNSAGHQVLVVSASVDGDDVVQAIGEGARGYLSKDAQANEIVAAIGAVASGRSYVSPMLAGHLLQASRQPTPRLPALSERECEVLGLLAQGMTDQTIASQLRISISTVRSHLDRIRDKTGERRRAELTRFAIEHRITAGPPDPDSASTKSVWAVRP
jgi:DNA-binding NarL/FixJ family response regulator